MEEQLARIAGLERPVVVEAVLGDTAGPGLAQPGAGGGGPQRARRLPAPPLPSDRANRGVPGGHCGRGAPPARVAATWPGASELEVVTAAAPTGTESIVVVAPHGRASPRLPVLLSEVGLVLRHRVSVRRAPSMSAWDTVCSGATAGVFWQVHVGAAEALLAAVLEAAAPRRGERVVDLYAGAGLFSVPLAAAVGPEGAGAGDRARPGSLRRRPPQRPGAPRPRRRRRR